MYVWLRLAKVCLKTLWGPRLGILDESSVNLRVGITDLDFNLHLNNGRYLALADLGRWDLTLRSGLVRLFFKYRWRPMMASITIRYIKSLEPFARFRLTTRMVDWDGKWMFMEHRFLKGDEVMAVALVKAVMKGPRGTVSPGEVMEALGLPQTDPPGYPGLTGWQDWESAALDMVRRERNGGGE